MSIKFIIIHYVDVAIEASKTKVLCSQKYVVLLTKKMLYRHNYYD